MLNVIHVFNNAIDNNSILEVKAAIPDFIDQYDVIYKYDPSESIDIEKVSKRQVNENDICSAINHLIENSKSERLIIISGSLLIHTFNMRNAIQNFVNNDYDFVTGDTDSIDGFYGVKTSTVTAGKLNFNSNMQVTKQKYSSNSVLLNPCIFFFKKSSFIAVGSLDGSLLYGPEAIVSLSIDIVRRGYEIQTIDETLISADSNFYTYESANQSIAAALFNTERMDHLNLSTCKNKLDNRKRRQEHFLMPLDDYLKAYNPVIIIDRELRRRFKDKSIAILYPGVSMDKIDHYNIYGYDFVIGIDFMARIFKCDYAFTQELHVLSDLLTVYHKDSIIATDYTFDRMQNKYINLRDVTDKAVIIETTASNIGLGPYGPYFMHSDPLICISHLAIAAKPKLIQIFGADFCWLQGRSHIDNPYYSNGFVRQESESTIQEYETTLRYLRNLSKVAINNNIRFMRNCHV